MLRPTIREIFSPLMTTNTSVQFIHFSLIVVDTV
jgi:hypothetical protein